MNKANTNCMMNLTSKSNFITITGFCILCIMITIVYIMSTHSERINFKMDRIPTYQVSHYGNNGELPNILFDRILPCIVCTAKKNRKGACKQTGNNYSNPVIMY